MTRPTSFQREMFDRLLDNIETQERDVARIRRIVEQARAAGVDTSTVSPSSPASADQSLGRAEARLAFLRRDAVTYAAKIGVEFAGWPS